MQITSPQHLHLQLQPKNLPVEPQLQLLLEVEQLPHLMEAMDTQLLLLEVKQFPCLLLIFQTMPLPPLQVAQ